MQTVVRTVVMLFLASLCVPASAARAEPIAVVAAIEGQAALTHGRTTVAASFGSSLEPGDRIAVAARSRVTLFFNDGNVVELAAGSSLTVGGRTATGNAAGGDKLPREAFAAVSNFRISGSRERGLVAAPALRSSSDAKRTPEPLSPRGTDLLEDRPAFAWREVASATRYTLRLSSAVGELWAEDTDQPALGFPAGAAALAEGEYLWEVQAFDAKGPLGRASATFRVIPVIQADAVRAVLAQIQASAGGPGSPAGRYLAGAYLFERGFLDAAASEFRALILLAPDSPAPHEALGDVYRAVGLMDLATASYTKASSLTPNR